jgi:FMN phosphatase YigB (HAD superfamily)
MGIIICDLDGTLCDAQHREHFAKSKQWDEFNSNCIHDPIYPGVEALLRGMMETEHLVLYVTGRDEQWRPQTEEWLTKHELFFGSEALLMRPKKDFRSDTIVKWEAFLLAMERFHFKPEDVLFVLEDRDKMVAMWRGAGLACYQVQPGAY